MPRKIYTPEERTEALDLLAQVGKAEAARRTGIPAGTIASWGSRTGVTAPPAAATAVATAARVATIAERKARLAEELLDDAERLRRQMFAATVERKALVVSDGHNQGSHAEVVDVKLTQPTFSDQRQIMTSIAIAIDKVQILTGEATQRVEVGARSEPAERRQRATGVVDELAVRRAG